MALWGGFRPLILNGIVLMTISHLVLLQPVHQRANSGVLPTESRNIHQRPVGWDAVRDLRRQLSAAQAYRRITESSTCNDMGADVDADAASDAIAWARDAETHGALDGERALLKPQTATICEDVGRSCLQEGSLLLYGDSFLSPAGSYKVPRPGVFRSIDQLRFAVRWRAATTSSGALASSAGYRGTSMRFEQNLGLGIHATSMAGDKRPPPAPFSACAAPPILVWDFPDNAWTTVSALTRVWLAIRSGALPSASGALVLMGHAHAAGLPAHIHTPLAAMFTGGIVTTLGNAAVALSELDEETRAAISGDTSSSVADIAGIGASSVGGALLHGAIAMPPVVCHSHRVICAVGDPTALPPNGAATVATSSLTAAGASPTNPSPPYDMYRFLRGLAWIVSGGTAGHEWPPQLRRPQNQSISGSSAIGDIQGKVPPHLRSDARHWLQSVVRSEPRETWPARDTNSADGLAPRFVTGVDGVLRVTIMGRGEGPVMRMRGIGSLVRDCNAHGSISVSSSGRSDKNTTASQLAIHCTVIAPPSDGEDDGVAAAMGDATVSARVAAARLARLAVVLAAETDVLIGMADSAALTWLGFLRPGSIVIEVRPGVLTASGDDMSLSAMSSRRFRALAVASGALKWFGLRLHGSSLEHPGTLEVEQEGAWDSHPRDRDVTLPWRVLRHALTNAVSSTYDEWLHSLVRESETEGGPLFSSLDYL